MCGRYYIESGTWDSVRTDFPDISDDIPVFPSGDIAPSMGAPSLISGDMSRMKCTFLKWGFPGFRDNKLIINARSEGIAEKKTFADSIRNRRCVLPASGFYEWDRSKQKVTFTLKETPVIYLAGVFRPFGDEFRFVIITREANESMLPVHDRVPLMIPAGNVKDWLYDRAAANELLKEPLPQLAAKREYEQLSFL